MAFQRIGHLLGADVTVAELKRRALLSEVVGQTVALRGHDGQWIGRCPFHHDRRPSLSVTDEPGLWHCHGCGAGGDVISFIMRSDNCSFVDAVKKLQRDLVGSNRQIPIRRLRSAKVRQSTYTGAAQEIWRVARGIPGTPAERYLASRGIVGGFPASLRFGRAPTWIDPATGEGRAIRPALLAACQDLDGRIIGIHRTFLSEMGAKAPMDQPRLALGQIRGGALRLGPERREIMLCEGIEDGLSLMRMFVGATVWVALGAGNMPHVRLPASVRRVIVAGDNDEAGRAAVSATFEALNARNIAHDEIYPKVGKDFNEEWQLLHA